MHSQDSASRNTDTLGNQVVFQRVVMDSNQNWVPVGRSLNDLKNMLVVPTETRFQIAEPKQEIVHTVLTPRSRHTRKYQPYPSSCRDVNSVDISDCRINNICDIGNVPLSDVDFKIKDFYDSGKIMKNCMNYRPLYRSQNKLNYAQRETFVKRRVSDDCALCALSSSLNHFSLRHSPSAAFDGETTSTQRMPDTRCFVPSDDGAKTYIINKPWTPILESTKSVYDIKEPSSDWEEVNVTADCKLLSSSCQTPHELVKAKSATTPVSVSCNTDDLQTLENASSSSESSLLQQPDTQQLVDSDEEYSRCEWIVDEWLEEIREDVCIGLSKKNVQGTTKRKRGREKHSPKKKTKVGRPRTNGYRDYLRSKSQQQLYEIFAGLQSQEDKHCDSETYELKESEMVSTSSNVNTRRGRVTKIRQKRKNEVDFFKTKETLPYKFFRNDMYEW